MTGVDKVVVDPDAGIVRISGRSKERVKQAKELLEYVERRYPIASSEATMLLKNGGTIAGGGVSFLFFAVICDLYLIGVGWMCS